MAQNTCALQNTIFQSTLLQEERPHEKSLNELMQISIHAPTRGATGRAALGADWNIISIHAPTRGATFMICSRSRDYLFQSTLLQEERQSHSSIPIPFILLSIHAPTRGATWQCNTSLPLQDFQSTLLQEERPVWLSHMQDSPTFNPRSYKRSDTLWSCASDLHYTFNPRSYKRSDTSK